MLQQPPASPRSGGQTGEPVRLGRVLSPSEAVRRAARLVGDESPLRPGPQTAPARPSLEFVDALGQLSTAFRELTESVRAIDAKVDALRKTLAEASVDAEGVQSRLNYGSARLESLDLRVDQLEALQVSALGAVERRIAGLTRQMGVAIGLGMMLAVLGGVGLYLGR